MRPEDEVLRLTAALLDALHDDALTTDALVAQVAYTGEVRRERDEARMDLYDARHSLSLCVPGRKKAAARVAALEAALDRIEKRVDGATRIGHGPSAGGDTISDETRRSLIGMLKLIREERARVQPAQGHEACAFPCKDCDDFDPYDLSDPNHPARKVSRD